MVHDHFTIQQFQEIENARSLFQQYLPPAFVEKARWDTLRVVPGHFIDDRLRAHFSDLLFSAELEGETVLFYILFEHKSWVDLWARLQLFVGMSGAWVDWCRNRTVGGESPVRLPFILPFVLYHGERGWTISKDFADLVAVPEGLRTTLEKHIPRFEHILVDLHAMPMTEIRGSLWVRLVLGLLKAVAEGREEEWSENIFEPSLQMLLEPDGTKFMRSLFEYLARASETVTPSTFQKLVDKISNQKTRKEFMTLAERFIEEGRQQGRQEGRQEGWHNGRQRAILDLLELRLGSVPVDVRESLALLKSDTELTRALGLSADVDSYAEFLLGLHAATTQ